jgi:hypothetical protein
MKKIVNKNLVWFTGAPGSKWSGSANILQAIPQLNFNTSDRSPEREYRHTGPTELARSIVHTGVYFGPGHGVGEHWGQFSNLDPASVEREISLEWTAPAPGRLLVKSHFLSHHLDHVASTWPDHPIVMIFRPNEKCEQGWFGAGGWDISYPDYEPFYKDDARMKAMIREHNALMKDFCAKHGIVEQPLDDVFLKETFGWSVDMIEDPVERAFVDVHLRHTMGTNDVTVAIYNLDKLK